MINFINYSSAMEHPYERKVSKLRFHQSFQKNTSLFNKNLKKKKLENFFKKFDILARTDSLLPAYLHKEDICSLKLRFLSISKPNNFCLLLSHIFSFPILAQTSSFLYPETSK